MKLYVAYINALAPDEFVSFLHADPDDYPGWPSVLGVFTDKAHAEDCNRHHRDERVNEWLRDDPDLTREQAAGYVSTEYSYHIHECELGQAE